MKKLVVAMESVGIKDVGLVGGKNASLGEMIRELTKKGVRVPGGFIITAEGYRYFLRETGLKVFIAKTLRGLNTRNVGDLARRGVIIREAIKAKRFPGDLSRDIRKFYAKMEREYGKNVDVAVRSSATAEDLPGASFAGEHDTFLGVRGADGVIEATRAAMASLFTARAISYREDKGFSHFDVALSVGVQKMVRSDKGCSGVMFTLDTESGFPDVILVNGSWGLGEMIVQGEVTPDEFLVWKKGLGEAGRNPIVDKRLGVKNRKMIYAAPGGGTNTKRTKIIPASPAEQEKFVLSDKEVLQLAAWGKIIEDHYSKNHHRWSPMDMEWAKDGRSGDLFIVQARPETIHAGRDFSKIREYRRTGGGAVIVKGASVGNKIATGKARVILDAKHLGDFKKGEILVTDMTDPDWEPIMKIASAIVTDKGGRTSHAAIVSRELGIPAVVGTESATRRLRTGMPLTVDTTGSEGLVLSGTAKIETIDRDVRKVPKPKTAVMVNVAMPETAFETSFLPQRGVGLAREEFIIASTIGIHPMALINYAKQTPKLRAAIDQKTLGWKDKTAYYVDKLAYGIARIGAAFHPHPVIVRFSDFKTNEYRTLLGGEAYEPQEENPMIGWRGASRYYDPKFLAAFALECRAMARARRVIGAANVIPMIPFCRTVEEAERVVAVMAKNGLDRKKDKTLKIYMMCEIPSNVILADKFLDIFDGYSIGSNDLTQLTLGLDRDSGTVAKIANENNEAVKSLIADVIAVCRKRKKYVGICGQAPSDYPDFAAFLVRAGISSISLNPDTLIATTIRIAEEEKRSRRRR